MVDKPHSNDPVDGAATTPPANVPRRGPGHRGADMRDTVAELTERAHLISQEAGGKVAAAMKDVISAGAGIAGFAIESARDLVQFMVRRGQMTMAEGDKLIREAQAAHDKRSDSEKARPTASKVAAEKAVIAKAEAAARAAAAAAAMPPHRSIMRPTLPPAPPVAAPVEKPAPAKEAAATPTKEATKAPAKTSAKAAAKPSAKPSAKPVPAKPSAKTAAKPARKPAAKSAAKAATPAKAAKKKK